MDLSCDYMTMRGSQTKKKIEMSFVIVVATKAYNIVQVSQLEDAY